MITHPGDINHNQSFDIGVPKSHKHIQNQSNNKSLSTLQQ